MNKKQEIKKGVTLLRVSTRRQGRSGNGLGAQRKSINYYFKLHKIRLVKEFVEIGSGRPRNRPQAQKAIEYCRQHNLTLFVAYQSRLARNVGFIYDLIESGFEFISVESPNDDKLAKLFKALMDERAGDDISSTTKTSLASAAEEKGVKFGGNSVKRKRTMKRKRRKYLKRIKPIIRREQKRQQQQQKKNTVRDLTSRLNKMRLKKVNGKRGGWYVSEVHGILRELATFK